MINKRNTRSFPTLPIDCCASVQRCLSLPEFTDIRHTLGKNDLFPTKLLDLKLEDSHVLHPLVVLSLAFIQYGLLDLDLLIEQSQLIIAPNQLRPEDVSLTDDLER